MRITVPCDATCEATGPIASGSSLERQVGDLQRLVTACGFELDRVAGDHHIYVHPDRVVNLNLQDVKGQAKPYQVRQALRILDRYDLVPEEFL